jgi:hypothetical protein
MISGLEKAFNKVQDDTVAVIRMLLEKRSYEEISRVTGLDLKIIEEIKNKFESNK